VFKEGIKVLEVCGMNGSVELFKVELDLASINKPEMSIHIDAKGEMLDDERAELNKLLGKAAQLVYGAMVRQVRAGRGEAMN
jgi:hypothetical protein